MFTSVTRRRARRSVAALLLACAGVAAATTTATATPWGTGGADYDGVLCRLGTTDVPMGQWTVNGSVPAFSTVDVNGVALAQGSAPVSGTQSTMVAGDAGFDAADIASVAYLLHAYPGGSPAELAELSADVAIVGGNGEQQRRCLGQQGTNAGRAASRLAEARRLAGPYTVTVEPEQNVIPGKDAQITAIVRAASGDGVRGIDVTFTAGGTVATATTGRGGRATTTVVASAAAATRVTATAAVPSDLVYLDTTPPAVTTAPLATVTGTGDLRPVLHPRPTLRVTFDQLAFSGDSVRPNLVVGGTFGYSGNGEVTLSGPVAAADCSSVSDDALGAAPVAWRQSFTFTGDATLRAGPTPQLDAGCYALRAALTVTNSSPQERAAAALVPLTVSALRVAAKASAPAALPGGLSATVTPTSAGRATVRTSLVARGPLPITKGHCQGDFDAAPVAGSSASATLRGATEVALPAVRRVGCYALVARNDVTLDGRSAITNSTARDATMAILEPGIAVNTAALSSEQGKPVPGTVEVTGTYGFAGTVAVGVVPGQSLPITGCRDTRFDTGLAPASTSDVAVRGDAAYQFRTPPTSRIACYAVVATYTLTGNKDVTATSGTASAIFLAGKRPASAGDMQLRPADPGSIVRAAVAYGIAGLLILLGCLALFVRTFLADRRLIPAGSLWPLLSRRPDDPPALARPTPHST